MKANLKCTKIFQAFLFLVITAIIPTSCELDDPLGNEAVAELEGVWSVDEDSEIFGKSTLSTYEVTISADPDKTNGIIIDDFYNAGLTVRATVTGSSLTISNQEVEDEYSVYGSGTISANSNEIEMSYVVNDGSAQDDHCTAVFTKK